MINTAYIATQDVRNSYPPASYNMTNLTNDTSLRNKIKQLKRAIKAGNQNPFLYKGEELRFMKRKLREILDVMTRYDKEQKNGFGV